MKAIYKGELYVVEDTIGDYANLSKSNKDELIQVPLNDSDLIIDPTDWEMEENGLL